MENGVTEMQELEALSAADRTMLEPIYAVFYRVRETHPGVLPCSRGCSYCCVAFFEITALDLWRLKEGLRQLEGEVRARVLERARAVIDLVREDLPEWQHPFDVRDIGEKAFVGLAQRLSASCPALGDDGECLVYDHRPRICRLQGLSYVDPAGGAELPDFCASSFGDEAYAALPPQPLALFDQWEQEAALRSKVSIQLPPGLGGGYRTFVTAALWVLDELEPAGLEVGRPRNAEVGGGRPGDTGVDPELSFPV